MKKTSRCHTCGLDTEQEIESRALNSPRVHFCTGLQAGTCILRGTISAVRRFAYRHEPCITSDVWRGTISSRCEAINTYLNTFKMRSKKELSPSTWLGGQVHCPSAVEKVAGTRSRRVHCTVHVESKPWCCSTVETVSVWVWVRVRVRVCQPWKLGSPRGWGSDANTDAGEHTAAAHRCADAAPTPQTQCIHACMACRGARLGDASSTAGCGSDINFHRGGASVGSLAVGSEGSASTRSPDCATARRGKCWENSAAGA